MRYGYNQLTLILGVIGTCFPIITVLLCSLLNRSFFICGLYRKRKMSHGQDRDGNLIALCIKREALSDGKFY